MFIWFSKKKSDLIDLFDNFNRLSKIIFVHYKSLLISYELAVFEFIINNNIVIYSHSVATNLKNVLNPHKVL